MRDDAYYLFPAVPPIEIKPHKTFRVRMFVPGQADVVMTTRAVSMEEVIDRVKSRRLPNAAGMRGFEVDEIDDQD